MRKTIRSSRNGPIVDEMLPARARHRPGVAALGSGFEPCGWLTALLGMNRAAPAPSSAKPLGPGCVRPSTSSSPTPTATSATSASGRIPDPQRCGARLPARLGPRAPVGGTDPLRGHAAPERPGARLRHHRQQPRSPRDDYPLSAVRHLVERLPGRARSASRSRPGPSWSPQDCQQLQLDVHSRPGVRVLPALVECSAATPTRACEQAVEFLQQWDCRT